MELSWSSWTCQKPKYFGIGHSGNDVFYRLHWVVFTFYRFVEVARVNTTVALRCPKSPSLKAKN